MWNFAKRTVAGLTPTFYRWAQRVRDRVVVEARVARQLGLGGLVRGISHRNSEWRRELPVQSVITVDLGIDLSGVEDFLDVATALVGPVAHGGHTVYLEPLQIARPPFSVIVERFPPNTGLKVIRRAGAPAGASYIAGDQHSRLQRAMVHEVRQMMLVANRLYAECLGPRYWDLIELRCGNASWTAYAVEHLGSEAADAEASACIAGLELLVRRGELGLVVPGGMKHPDFLPPSYGGNVRAGADGTAKFVDFQNFTVGDHGRYLRRLAEMAAVDTHFGETSIFRGGKYLYQQVPGSGLAAKREISQRVTVIDRMLEAAGHSLANRLVIDFGCNVGMMLAEYLRRGARWGVGYDMDYTVPHTERLLLGIGCTRFSLFAGTLAPDVRVLERLPAWLRADLKDCVVSYLAVRGHFGWLEDLFRPEFGWTMLIYEGHEGETEEATLEFLAPVVARSGASVAQLERIVDGDSRVRCVALLVR